MKNRDFFEKRGLNEDINYRALQMRINAGNSLIISRINRDKQRIIVSYHKGREAGTVHEAWIYQSGGDDAQD